MERCRAKRGFFSLRDCGEMSVRPCELCGRPMCSQHLSPMSGFTRCLDCEGRQAEKEVIEPRSSQQADQPLSDPSWPHRYRGRYYNRSGYGPIYTGRYYDPYYDNYDTRSFDPDMSSRGPSAAVEHGRGPGLEDS